MGRAHLLLLLLAAALAGPAPRAALPERDAPADTFLIAFSDSATSDGARPLAGATVSEVVYVFLMPLYPRAAVERVEFSLDLHPLKTEIEPPYDLLGTLDDPGRAEPLDTRRLVDGSHAVSVVVHFADGGQLRREAWFEVRNGD